MAVNTHSTAETHDRNTGAWVKYGALGGLIAGIVFAMFEMIMAALLNGASAFWNPLRMIGATVLGKEALSPDYGLVTAALTGMIVHMMFAVVFGIVFALALAFVPGLARSAGMLIVAASLYGLLLWVVNFYVVAPVAGWNWFPDKSEPLVQFVAHTFFFGTVLGLVIQRGVSPSSGRNSV
jgi:uncharacterized membrane protein YagU involved in acid resistance